MLVVINSTHPQFLAFILQTLAYIFPSDPQAGLAFLQQDSLQCRVVWQYFLLVLTTPCLEKRIIYVKIFLFIIKELRTLSRALI